MCKAAFAHLVQVQRRQRAFELSSAAVQCYCETIVVHMRRSSHCSLASFFRLQLQLGRACCNGAEPGGGSQWYLGISVPAPLIGHTFSWRRRGVAHVAGHSRRTRPLLFGPTPQCPTPLQRTTPRLPRWHGQRVWFHANRLGCTTCKHHADAADRCQALMLPVPLLARRTPPRLLGARRAAPPPALTRFSLWFA